jgi:serpin B
MISPLSISYALSMTMNGANGDTRDSILKALRLTGLTPEEINGSYKKLTDALLSVDQRIAISIANSVWIENNFVVKKPFIDILTSYYNAGLKQFDILDQTVPGTINNWISDKTNGLIKNMIDVVPSNTVMLLINAIYFKGKWTSEFDKAKTENASFYKPGGTASVPMMNQEASFKAYKGDGFLLGEFPYGQGNFAMDIILPDGNDGISGLLPSVTGTNFATWLSQMNEQKVDLSVPRFKYGYKLDLEDILSDMGMGIAFTDGADLSNISDIALLISKVLHQSFIETNEEGTEAAAVTVVVVGTTSVGPSALVFNANHPFLYIIRETTTNSILFMGKVADPAAN